MKYFLSVMLLLFVTTTLFSQVKNFQPDRPDYKLKGKVAKLEVTTKQYDEEYDKEFNTTIFNDFGYPLCEYYGKDTSCIYFYDEMGNLTKTISAGLDKKIINYYEVDKNNNMSKKSYEGINIYDEYEWNENKLVLKRKPEKEYFLFDNKGLLIEQLNNSRKVMKYNNKKELIEETIYDGEKITSSVTYKYNSNGDPIKIISRSMYEPAPRVMNIKYVYDKKGNWINKIKIEEGSSYKISEMRKITYKEELPTAKSKTKKK